jgi:lipopolysaccharide export system permease protein
VLFFIGAPLGAIIKKGGLGLPVVFSIIFFLIFHISSITGEKMSNSGSLEPFEGMWLSTSILTPIAVFLTYKAANDSALFDRGTYEKLIKRLLSLTKKANR